MKQEAYLVGPFLGSLQWEYTYFVPYIINIIKNDPNKLLIVFTRSSSFDLYGAYTDIFVPLKVINDKEELRYCFTLKGIRENEYNAIIRAFIDKYKMRYRIKDKIYPEISYYSFKVKWQFSRSKVDYDFRPRSTNKPVADKLMSGYKSLIDIDKSIGRCKSILEFSTQVSDEDDNRITLVGCFIEAIKQCDYVISNLSSDVGRLSLLLKRPVITVNEKLSNDEIHLINPLNTPVIRCNDIKEGIEIYENNIRSS